MIENLTSQKGEGGVSWGAKTIALQHIPSWSPIEGNSRSVGVSTQKQVGFLCAGRALP